jgi:catechol 2,3-dioxygenase-like lactoylglutathione lyase family enzyme
MFANTKAYSGFAVDDLQKAREFYGETLGLKTSEEYGLMTLHLAGDRPRWSTRSRTTRLPPTPS